MDHDLVIKTLILIFMLLILVIPAWRLLKSTDKDLERIRELKAQGKL